MSIMEMEKLTKASLKELRERAERAQKHRKKAPSVDLSGVDSRIPMKVLERRVHERYMRDGINPSTIHTIPIPMNRAPEFAERGYSIELDEAGQPYENDGHVMMTIPQEQFDASRETVRERSSRKRAAAEADIKKLAEKTGSTVEMKSGHIDTSDGESRAVVDVDNDDE